MFHPKGLAEKIKEKACQQGFDDVGIASVDDGLPHAENFLRAYKNGYFGPLDYLEKTLQARINIKSIFPNARSMVVVAKNYFTGHHQDHCVKECANDRAKIARYAWGKDYHQWFKNKLRSFGPFLKKEVSKTDVEFWPFNDTGPFIERLWAYKAGLGFIGKSSMFISRKFGTWTLLGGFATNLELPADGQYVGPDCGSCDRCVRACPTGAIIGGRQVDARKCIATWTIERPLHPDSIKMAPRGHSWGFGCDVCQEVCPWNKFEKVTTEERFRPLAGRIFLSSETFSQDLRGSPLYRSRKSGLMANFVRIRKSLKEPGLKLFSPLSD